MKHPKSLLVTAIFSTILLAGCASTGTTPASTQEAAPAATPAPSSPAPAPAAKPAAEPECD